MPQGIYGEDPTHENEFLCPKDGTIWFDYWTCACDDDCPTCGLNCSPISSVEMKKD